MRKLSWHLFVCFVLGQILGIRLVLEVRRSLRLGPCIHLLTLDGRMRSWFRNMASLLELGKYHYK